MRTRKLSLSLSLSLQLCKRIMSVIYESIRLRLYVLVFRTVARYDMLVGRDIAETATW